MGVFARIFSNLVADDEPPDCLMIDSTHLKAHRTAGSGRLPRPSASRRRCRGEASSPANSYRPRPSAKLAEQEVELLVEEAGVCMTPSMETMAPTIIFRMSHSPCLV
jgi:hypothetical protein